MDPSSWEYSMTGWHLPRMAAKNCSGEVTGGGCASLLLSCRATMCPPACDCSVVVSTLICQPIETQQTYTHMQHQTIR